jgi:uncharacterized RmlC-like cupin family protein
MEFIEFTSYIVKTTMENHPTIKNKLLMLFSEADSESTQKHSDLNPFENVTKLDWSKSTDRNREWVKYFYPILQDKLNGISTKMGYSRFLIEAIWFQQYEKESYHGWHVHGSNFTAVYYVEMDKLSAPTELVDPSLNRKIHLDVKEGDIIFFPSYVIHRGPANMSDKRKTIISFNTSSDGITDNVLKIIEKLS